MGAKFRKEISPKQKRSQDAEQRVKSVSKDLSALCSHSGGTIVCQQVNSKSQNGSLELIICKPDSINMWPVCVMVLFQPFVVRNVIAKVKVRGR